MSDDPSIDPSDFRRVLGHFPTGVTVVTCDGSAGPIGVAIGSFASISLDPPLVGFFLGSQSSSGDAINDVGHFCVNVLSSGQQELCGRMASKADDKFDGVDWTPAPATGAPVLPGIVASIDCRLDRIVDAGDHNLLVGRVLALATHDDEADPMVFFQGKYGGFAG